MRSLTYILDSTDPSLPGHVGGLTSILAPPSSPPSLFSAGRDGTVRKWAPPSPSFSPLISLEPGDQITPPVCEPPTPSASAQLHTGWANDIAAVLDSVVALCSLDLLVRLWNHNSGLIATLGHHTDYVTCVSKGDTFLASGGLDRRVNTWDPEKCALVRSYETTSLVYALGAHQHSLGYGGIANCVGLLDTRSPEKPTLFVGHTDTVRSVCLTDDWVLLALLDTTVKLWLRKTNTLFRSFGMHHTLVWSLWAQDQTFYSGDRAGQVFKTVWGGPESSQQENAGVSVLVAHTRGGVNALAARDGLVWCATDDNAIYGFWDPNLDAVADNQRTRVPLDVEDTSEIEERPSFESFATSTSEYVDIEDELVQSAYPSCFVDVLGGPLVDYVVVQPGYPVVVERADKVRPSMIIPVNPFPTVIVRGNPAVIKARMLNDRQTVVTLDEEGMVRVWNALKGELCDTPPVKTSETGKRFSGSPVSNSSQKPLSSENPQLSEEQEREAREAAEHAYEHRISEMQQRSSHSAWCQVAVKIGRVFLTLTQNTVAACEMYVDELESIFGPQTNDELRVGVGKMVLRLLTAHFIEECVQRDLNFRQALLEGKLRSEDLLKEPKYARFMERAELEESETEEENTQEGGQGWKFGRFGRREKDKKEKEKERKEKVKERKEKFKEKKDIELVSVADLLDKLEFEYLMSEDYRTSLFKLASEKEVPMVKQLLEGIKVLVNETVAKGSTINRCEFDSAKKTFTDQEFRQIAELLPYWVGLAMLKNEYTEKAMVKINFVVEQDDDTLPGLGSGVTRLSAHELIRVHKIMGYILEKFEKKTDEMKRDQKVQEWLELSCNGEVLPTNMTLITIKTRVWRNLGDVVLKYRRKSGTKKV